MVRRFTAALTIGVCVFLGGMSAAFAAPNYPPGQPISTVAVEGVKVGQVSGSSGSGLPHTGFDPAIVVIALTLLAVGVGLLFLSRSRRHAN